MNTVLLGGAAYLVIGVLAALAWRAITRDETRDGTPEGLGPTMSAISTIALWPIGVTFVAVLWLLLAVHRAARGS